jgi:UDP-glucuronate 4-epimerase
MTVLVTGTAGFIGFHVTTALLARGERVVGVDNLNDYYDVTLKEARLAELLGHRDFTFDLLDIADRDAVAQFSAKMPDITKVVHLAAQAGVRYSLSNPYAYTRANIEGQLVMIEEARRWQQLEHFVFASSSSVYGGNTKLPFAVEDRVDCPVSLYAATKKAAELMSYTYSHLYGIPQSGLRFFTVYGPWGRPDMAAFIFTSKILKGEPIPVFNSGDMRRDFTYIDDIVAGVLGCLDNPPATGGAAPYRLYNLGNSRSEKLLDYITVIEEALGRKATFELLPMQTGDVKETFADISAAQKDFSFSPKTTIREGLPRFIDWYRSFYKV